MRLLLAIAAAVLSAIRTDSDRATAMITVTGGEHPGTFVVRNAETPCEILDHRPPLPKHQFSVTLGATTPNKDPKALTLLMLIVPNADLRGPNHTFFTSIIFGDGRHGTEYAAESRDGEKQSGGGTVTIVPHGSDATVTLDVTSRDGVSYKGTIQCSGVSRN